MKKYLFVLMFIILSICYSTNSFSARYDVVTITSLKTADAVILASPGQLLGLLITPDTSNSCAIRLYNNTTEASGSTIWYELVKSSDGVTSGPILPFPIPFSLGLYADITTSGTCNYQIIYQTYVP
jgi:hypothetical protein